MLLIYPPLAKPCEPPAGIARLAGSLRKHNLPCTLLDANIEAFSYLFKIPVSETDTWSKRASRNLSKNLAALKSAETYKAQDRYRRAVSDINRIIEISGKPDVYLNLANYQERNLSPIKSHDLIQAAEQYKLNIFYNYFSKRLPEIIEGQNPSAIGISLNYLSQAISTMAICGFIKNHYPQLIIILGGGLVTSWLQNPGWKNPFGGLVDHLVAGPGESKLLEIIKTPAKAVLSPVKLSADELGMHDFTGLPFSQYISPGNIIPYAASSGCYWNKCSFCPETAEENPYLAVPSEKAHGEISMLVAKHQPVMLHFLDNAVSPAMMSAMSRNPPGPDWYGFARVNHNLADDDFCSSLRRSGCRMLKLGIESGDQDVLDSMNKGIDLLLVAKVLASLKKAGIATYVYLLFGTPGEDLDAARRTLSFASSHHAEITFLNLAIFNMPVCSLEASKLAVNDFYEADLSIYTDFDHPKGWQRKNIRQFLDQEFKKNTNIAAILRRDPPFFTSNHAAFLT